MPLILSGNVGSATAATGFNVDRSLRFNSGSSDSITRTNSSASNRRTFTVSFWLKKTSITTEQNPVFAGDLSGSNPYFDFRFDNTQIINWYGSASNGSEEFNLKTNRVFKDPNAWYHFVLAVDTTQGTGSNRLKLYVNGVQETSFSKSNYPGQNYDTPFNDNNYEVQWGAIRNNSPTLDGYLAEMILIDGQQLDPTSFGEFDEDSPTIWKPKDVSGLTFGTNGFYLNAPGPSTGQNSNGLGGDSSGNGNHFASSGLAAIDQSFDTCTNNFAILNILDNQLTPHSLSEGNLKQTTDSTSGYAPNVSSIAVSQGKWYFEVKYVSRSNSDNYNLVGIKGSQITNTGYLGKNAYEYGYYSQSGKYYTSNNSTSYGDSYDQGDVIGCYLDLDNSKLYFAKNGTLQNSGTGISITAAASTPLGHYFFAVGDYGQSLTLVNEINFGSPISSISSGNTDANGYGNFEYDPSSGTFDGASKDFYALNTKNLAEFG